MSGGSLSQEEIDALLKAGETAGAADGDTPVADVADAGAAAPEPPPVEASSDDSDLTESERDTIGEIGNICMSSAATTRSTLLSRPVQITTPSVELVGESDAFEPGDVDLLAPGASVVRRTTPGGASPASVAVQLTRYRARLQADRDGVG